MRDSKQEINRKYNWWVIKNLFALYICNLYIEYINIVLRQWHWQNKSLICDWNIYFYTDARLTPEDLLIWEQSGTVCRFSGCLSDWMHDHLLSKLPVDGYADVYFVPELGLMKSSMSALRRGTF